RVLEALGELAHPHEDPKGFLIAPAVDGDRRPPELVEKRQLAQQMLRRLWSRLQEMKRGLQVKPDLLVGETRSRMGCGLAVVADCALDVAGRVEMRRERARDLLRASCVSGFESFTDDMVEAPAQRRRQAVIDHLLVEDVTERVAGARRAVGP